MHMSEWEAIFCAQPRVNVDKMKPVYQSQNKHSDGLKKDSLRAVYMNQVACILKISVLKKENEMNEFLKATADTFLLIKFLFSHK